MEQGRIVLITGAPGTGKTTVSAVLAETSALPRSVNLHTDDFYHYLSKGAIPPQLPEANEQNRVVIEAFAQTAKRFARGGYDVIVDGIIGPWFLAPWQKAAAAGYEVHYIVLRASREETVKRATGRAKLDEKTNLALVDAMWGQFAALGCYEANALDTTALSPADTVAAVKAKLESKTDLLRCAVSGQEDERI